MFAVGNLQIIEKITGKRLIMEERRIPTYSEKNAMREIKDSEQRDGVAVIGISRHRLGTDGKGITTLVAFHGCPLRCKYCLNKECWEPEERFRRYTPQSLYDELKIDDLYFRATGGGVTFGGGEPCLQADFIVEFRKLCGPDWKIRVETSLNVEQSLIGRLAPVVDEWFVDVKAERSVAYKEYTGVYRRQAMDNLSYLTSRERLSIPKEKVHIKIPIIPGFVDEAQAEETRQLFADIMEYPDVEVFRYVTDKGREKATHKGRGKRVCELLKDIRREVTFKNGIALEERECTHKGDCPGTCPVCEMEVAALTRQLEGKDILVSHSTIERIEDFDSTDNTEVDFLPGIVPSPLIGEVDSWTPEYRYKKFFFKECAVAGISFHLEKNSEIWNELEEGTEIALIRDRNNKHDRNAVAVALADDYDGDPDDFDLDLILGYVPRTDNAELAAMMDAGYAGKFTAEITTCKRHGNYNDRIRITIYIESSKREIVRPDLLRAESISTYELRKMTEELAERGTAYFRWGGFPHHELQFPVEGEKVVMVHRDEDSEILYLMRVLATGDDCARYVEHPDTIHCIDDCAPFILTNVMGPVRIKKSDWPFLEGVDMCGFSATDYVHKKLSCGFNEIFKSQLMKTLNRNNVDTDPSIDEPMN